MRRYIVPFLVMGAIFAILIFFLAGRDFWGELNSTDNLNINASSVSERFDLARNTVTIKPLPPHQVLCGFNVEFKGKKDIILKLEGTYGRSLRIINFQAAGENAHKSVMKVVWKDGSTDVIAPGSSDIMFAEDRIVKSIIISGYSVHERKIFKDSSRPGILNWEIRYEPVM